MSARINLIALLLASSTMASAAAADLYQITKSIPLGTPDSWDYVIFNAQDSNVYIAHGDRVTVVDPAQGKVTGEVTGMPGGTHGVAFGDGSRKVGYTDDGRNNKVVAFDPMTLKTVTSFDVDEDPDAITHDGTTGHVFVVNGRAGKLTEIDPDANKVLGTITLGTSLEAVGGDTHGKFFANGNMSNELIRVDLATRQVDGRWPLAGCTGPTGMAIDYDNDVVFSSCRNGVMTAVDGHTGKILATLPIGQGTDTAAFDPKRKRVFSSNGRDGTITVIQENSPTSFSVIGTIKTQDSGRTMAVNVNTGELYVAAATPDPNAKMPAMGPGGPQGGPPPGGPPGGGQGGPPQGGPQAGPPPMGSKPGSLKLLVLDPVS